MNVCFFCLLCTFCLSCTIKLDVKYCSLRKSLIVPVINDMHDVQNVYKVLYFVESVNQKKTWNIEHVLNVSKDEMKELEGSEQRAAFRVILNIA